MKSSFFGKMTCRYEKVEHKESHRKNFSLEKCHGDFDYLRNMNENLVMLSFFVLNQCSFGINRGTLVPPK